MGKRVRTVVSMMTATGDENASDTSWRKRGDYFGSLYGAFLFFTVYDRFERTIRLFFKKNPLPFSWNGNQLISV